MCNCDREAFSIADFGAHDDQAEHDRLLRNAMREFMLRSLERNSKLAASGPIGPLGPIEESSWEDGDGM